MNLSSHLQELRRKHQTLAQQVEEAQRAPAVDDLQVAELKREKLRLKDQIEKLSQA